jgi:HEPN domain-containing protein
MKPVIAAIYYVLGQHTKLVELLLVEHGDEVLSSGLTKKGLEVTKSMLQECEYVGLTFSSITIKRLLERLEAGDFTASEYRNIIKELDGRISDELAEIVFLHLPKEHTNLYDDKPQFGSEVADKFPKAMTDIQEGAKCFAVGRSTATVFHLMRVMEYAVQYLGKRLNISLVAEKNWANILDEVDKAIKALPVKNSRQKANRNKYAESSAHLRMVKDAWRNDVMHPKETYTEEEAERIFRNVKDFMIHLAIKL